MKKKYMISFFVAFMCLFIGACCHGLRTSGDSVKFITGVTIGVIMIAGAVGFGITGLVMLIKSKNGK